MIQCEGCYYQDKKDNVCCHENPFFDIDDNCTDYIENEFVKKIRADAINEFIDKFIKRNQFKQMNKCECINAMYVLAEQLKEGENNAE